MSSLKLKLPGAIHFASNIYSLFTGLAFTVIVTRTLTISDFGLWTMISQYIAYTAGPLANIASFWIIRYVARGFKGAVKSGFIFGAFLSSIGLSLYLLLAILASNSFSQPLAILLLAAPQAITYIMLGTLSSAVTGTSPTHIGISNIVFETSKVVMAYSFVRILKMGLAGAIISVILAQTIQGMYLVIMLRGFITQEIMSYDVIKKWFKLSWLPLYGLFSGLIGGFDVLMARIISSTDALIGARKVASIAGSFPNYVSSLSLSLYPRSLGATSNRRWEEDVEELLKFMSFMAIPIALGNIVLMDLLLEIFGSEYVNAYLAGIVVVIASLIALINYVVDPVLMGSETIDLKNDVSFREYARSMISKVMTLNHLSAVIYVAAVSLAIMLSTGEIYQATLYWSLASFTGAPFMIYKIKMLNSMGVRFKVPAKNIARFFLSSALMALIVSGLRSTILGIFAGSVVRLIMGIAVLTIIGGCIYFTLVFLIDDYARKLAKETRNILKQLL